jgi:hypothetical protein
MPRVLLVSTEDRVCDPIADSLEAEGYEVMWCPGPRCPTFDCPGGRGDRCALAVGADVVVLDGWLAGDVARKGPPSWHLASFYRAQQIPVVYLVGPDGLPGPVRDVALMALSREEPAAKIVDGVSTLLSARRGLQAAND